MPFKSFYGINKTFINFDESHFICTIQSPFSTILKDCLKSKATVTADNDYNDNDGDENSYDVHENRIL